LLLWRVQDGHSLVGLARGDEAAAVLLIP
jgi:hypothetical protein